MNEVVRSVYFNQTEILRGITQLHCPNGFDCDVTYGNGAFYKNLPQQRLKIDIDPQQDGVTRACSKALPLRAGTIQSIVFDPPFLTYIRSGREGNGKMVMSGRFSGYWRYDELETHYQGSLVEAYRVLVAEGVLVFKCQDIIHNHKMHCTHATVIEMAERVGFRLLDLFVLAANHRLPAPNRNGTQKHARIFHSYFLVFKRDKKVLDSTKIQEYNSSTVKQEITMSQCSVCSEIQFTSPTGITCKNGHDNAPAQQRVALEGSATMDNKAVLDSSPKPQVENQVPIDKLVKIYVKIRDALSAEKKKYETIEAEFKGQMAMIATELKARAQAEGVEGFRTDFGTVYMSETMKTSCADWSAFGDFLKDHDPLEFLEKRISSTAIKEYMKQTDGQLPPGVSIFKELEARVRRSGEK